MAISLSKSDPLTGDLRSARIVVAVGRGVGSREGVLRAVELARILDAQVAGTRGAADRRWLPREREVGLSGCRVRPELYLACGISGANFHTIGMEHSQCIAAVNTDPKARIFELAHIPIVDEVNHFLERFISHLTVTGFRPDAPAAVDVLKAYLNDYRSGLSKAVLNI